MKALKELIGDSFDFDKIVPMPEELKVDAVGETGCKVMVVCDHDTMLCHLASGDHGGKSIMEAVNAHFNPTKDIISLAQAAMDEFKPCEECINLKNLDFPLDESVRRLKEYDTDNWYDWGIKNWGTLWNASDVQIDYSPMPNSNSLGEVATISFQTAWSPPEPIYNKLCDLFPNLDIKWHYSEPGCDFAGDFDTDTVNEFADPCECDDSGCYECHPETADN